MRGFPPCFQNDVEVPLIGYYIFWAYERSSVLSNHKLKPEQEDEVDLGTPLNTSSHYISYFKLVNNC